jgi:DNA-binding NarL/FixJ family response regulator
VGWKTATRLLLHSEQPILAEGFVAVLEKHSEFELAASSDTLRESIVCLMTDTLDVALIDMASEMSIADLRQLRQASPGTALLLWGHALADEFVFQAVQLGVRGLLSACTPAEELLATLHRARNGELCFPTEIMEAMLVLKRVVLTPRESQLVSLIAQGLSNKEIGASLGLSTGTIKVYLTRVFKKLNLNDRLDLALYGLKNFFGTPVGQKSQHVVCPRSLPVRPKEQVPMRMVN